MYPESGPVTLVASRNAVDDPFRYTLATMFGLDPVTTSFHVAGSVGIPVAVEARVESDPAILLYRIAEAASALALTRKAMKVELPSVPS